MNSSVLESGSNSGRLRSSKTALTIRTFISSPSACAPGYVTSSLRNHLPCRIDTRVRGTNRSRHVDLRIGGRRNRFLCRSHQRPEQIPAERTVVCIRLRAGRIQCLAVAHRDEVQTGNDQEDLMARTRAPERVLRQFRVRAVVVAPPPDAAVARRACVAGDRPHRLGDG